MRLSLRSLLLLILLLPPLAHPETRLAGVTLADSYTLDGQSLVLNGAGVRSKFFVKVYVGALYLPQAMKTASAILAQPGPRSMQMYMLYKRVSADKITDGWTEGFRANLKGQAFAALEQRLQRFNSLFPELKRGDVVRMDYVPDQGTALSINGKTLGIIEGADFSTALLKVWIGEHPADDDLKEGLLGS